MKLPSLSTFMSLAWKSTVRFPLAISMLIVGILCATSAIDHYNALYAKVGLLCLLGFPLSISITLFLEQISNKKKYILILSQASLCLLLVVYFMATPEMSDFSEQDVIMHIMLLLISFLSLSFAPFRGKNPASAFWLYNREIFKSLFFGMLFSLVIWGGLSLALVSIHELFNVRISENVYAILFFFIFGFIGIWYFAAHIPQNPLVIEKQFKLPIVLDFLLKDILFPLIGVYILILYVYAINILIRWELPNGWVSGLILSLASVGIAALLVALPSVLQKGNRMYLYAKSFLIAFTPLLILLFVAIGRRVLDYGYTPKRYLVLAAATWLCGFVLYFLLSKKKAPKFIPISLALFILFSSFGWWGCFSVSKRSQAKQLEIILTEYNILVDGKINPAEGAKLDDSTAVKINQILEGLVNINGGIKSLEKRWNVSFSSNTDANRHDVIEALGIDNSSIYYGSTYHTEGEYFSFYTPSETNSENGITITGYDYFLPEKTLYNYTHRTDAQNDTISFKMGSSNYSITFAEDGNKFCLINNKAVIYEKDMQSYFDTLLARGFSVPHDGVSEAIGITDEKDLRSLDFKGDTPNYHLNFLVSNFSGHQKQDSSIIPDDIRFTILVKKK